MMEARAVTLIADLKHSGHWPSLLAAFLHFDTSFMVWVILGALAPFIAVDVTVTGPSLTITPLAGVTAGRYVLATGPAATTAHAAPGVYRLTIWRAGTAPSAHTRPVEAYTLDNAQPATLAALNRQSRLIRVAPVGPHAPAPHQQTVPLQSSAQLRAHGREEQVVATGLSASAKGLLIALPLLGTALFRILLGLLSDRYSSKRIGTLSLALTLVLRPVGGGLADRLGGTRVLGLVYSTVAAALVGVGVALASGALAGVLLLVAMGCLGMGNGAVFQVVSQRFRGEIGAITGLVGAAGGVGGFYLNVILGNLKDGTGTYATGFWVFAVTALAALAVLRLVARSWDWLAAGGPGRRVYDRHEAVAPP